MIKISKIFHPAFLPIGATNAQDIARKRVTSGRPEATCGRYFWNSRGAKLTDRIIAAMHEIRRRRVDAKLVIAGYDVRNFSSTRASELKDLNVTLFDGPTDLQLLHLMAEVDVAVQLRLKNWAESSGVVSQLLGLGKSVIVSAIGTFNEFGQAVLPIPVDAELMEIADGI